MKNWVFFIPTSLQWLVSSNWKCRGWNDHGQMPKSAHIFFLEDLHILLSRLNTYTKPPPARRLPSSLEMDTSVTAWSPAPSRLQTALTLQIIILCCVADFKLAEFFEKQLRDWMELRRARGPLSVAERQIFEWKEEKDGESFFAGTRWKPF